ncbi:MAG: hypothetical protein U0871_09220 [Gemmataceae bacterium]
MAVRIQFKSKSLRNANKKRMKSRKNKLRSSKKAKRLKAGRRAGQNA